MIQEYSISFIVFTNSRVYCAISLAPVQLGITSNTEVTQNGPRANELLLRLSISHFPRGNFNVTKARIVLPQACLLVQTDCDVLTPTHPA